MVTVLMSTYNGERYLHQQIESIIVQKGVELRLVVRDDGSKDSTRDILESYQKRDLLTWYTGKNLKPTSSFMQLLMDAPDSDFYAFADQDDYWEPEKLSVAITKLDGNRKIPAIYFSQTQMADADLKDIPTPKINPLMTFGETLVYAFVTGCTVVINKQLRDILVSHPWPKYILHDHWAYMVTLAIGGKAVFDDTPHILYRQHDNNVVGLNKSKMTLWKERFNRIFVNKEHIRRNTAEQLLEDYSEIMTEETRTLTQRFVKSRHSFIERMLLLFDDRYKCGDRHTWMLFKLGILYNSL